MFEKMRTVLVLLAFAASMLAACGGNDSSNSSSGALYGTDWTITKYLAIDTSACGWQMSFDILGKYEETRSIDCGVGMEKEPCQLSGSYSSDTGGAFVRTIAVDSCFSGPGTSVGIEALGYSIDTAPTPDVITVTCGVNTIITAQRD